jgi:hypothetical protein
MKKKCAHGQFGEKQITHPAWLVGQKQALRIHDVMCGWVVHYTLYQVIFQNF